MISLTYISILSFGAGWCAGMLWRTTRDGILKCSCFLTSCIVFRSLRRVLPLSCCISILLEEPILSNEYDVPFVLLPTLRYWWNKSVWWSQMLLGETFVAFPFPKQVSAVPPTHRSLYVWMVWYGGWREEYKTVSSGCCAVYSGLNICETWFFKKLHWKLLKWQITEGDTGFRFI